MMSDMNERIGLTSPSQCTAPEPTVLAIPTSGYFESVSSIIFETPYLLQHSAL